ncbi:MAG: carbon-nitrogen hydrolase [Thermoplasmata archaeon]|nr:carbon-nitrogen hydrolase [Thermoplasmata archaeon]
MVFPELVTTGYYMGERFLRMAEPRDGPTVALAHELARRYGFHVVLGLAERGDDGKVYDSSFLVGPSGLRAVYRKIHLWDTENSVFTPGDEAMAVDTEGPLGRVGLMVCYDLEFPDMADEVGAAGASLIAAPAAFTNLTLWQATLKARARELGVPVVAANRIGHELDTTFCGHSSIVDADGTVLAEAGDDVQLILADVTVDAGNKGRPAKDTRLIHPEFG